MAYRDNSDIQCRTYECGGGGEERSREYRGRGGVSQLHQLRGWHTS